MKIDPSGKIYVGGGGFKLNEWKNVEIARLNVDGSLDFSFGSSGSISHDFGGENEIAKDMAIQQDGKLVVAGNIVEDGNIDFLVARFHSDGEIDETFSSVGWASFDFDGAADDARYVYILPSNKILVVGVSNLSSMVKMSVLCLEPNGDVDDSFGNSGVLSIELSSIITAPRGVVIQNNEKILIGCQIGTQEFGLLRLNKDGTFDDTFGSNGIVSHVVTTAPINSISDIIQQSDGSIIMSGFTGSYPNYKSCLVALDSTGAIDLSFAENGVSIINLSDSTNHWTNLLELADERFLVSGNANNSVFYDHVLAKFISELSVGVIDEYDDINEVLVYPIPFESYEILEYSLISRQEISIILYDIQGRLVQILLSSTSRNKGSHNEILSFESDLPSGQYYLKIKGQSFVKSIKITKR